MKAYRVYECSIDTDYRWEKRFGLYDNRRQAYESAEHIHACNMADMEIGHYDPNLQTEVRCEDVTDEEWEAEGIEYDI